LDTLRQFLPAVPEDMATPFGLAGVGVVLLGMMLWLAGSRFSRGILTLAAVAIGASVGLRLPGWFGWPVQNWATASGGALVLGIVAYAVHNYLVKLLLAMLLGLWTLLISWQAAGGKSDWEMPHWGRKQDIVDYAQEVWKELPQQWRLSGPIGVGTALAAGLLLGVFLPRLASMLFHSVLGVTLVVMGGSYAVPLLRPQWEGIFTGKQNTQLIVLGGMVAAGVLVQWLLTPGKKKTSAPPSPEKQDQKPSSGR